MKGDDYIQKQKIPLALSLISYLYFLNGAWILALGGYFIFLCVSANKLDLTDPGTIGAVSYIVFGLVLLGVSRGLRRCSRGWRICALIFTWIGIAGIIADGYNLLAPQLQPVSHKPVAGLFAGLSTQNIILLLVAALLFQLWQLRVLTRVDVRDLFLYRS